MDVPDTHDQQWSVPESAHTDLRIATVMTGGVSLAVWMGGVGHELHSLAQAQRGGPYADLCATLGTRASIDVISGTSAGGINGALLGLATVFPTDLDFVRDLWLEEGSLEQLLRSPTERSPRSLLKGDQHFLPALERTFGSVPRRHTADDDVDVTLLISTTLLQGESHSVTDDFGTVIRDTDHLGTFRFSRGDLEREDSVRLLAKAARCSASFPGAFEASFCRVDANGTDEADDEPNLSGIIDSTINRYTVDGGLLNNKPLGTALRAIFDRPPGKPVRRVMVYVVPDPGASTYGEAETKDQPPELSRVLVNSLLEIPLAQSISNDLAELRRHNRRVELQRFLREELLYTGLAAGDVNEQQYQRYRTLRAERLVDVYVEELTRQLNGLRAAGRLPAGWRAVYEFNADGYRRLRARLIDVAGDRLPDSFPTEETVDLASLASLGADAVRRTADMVLSLAQRATTLCRHPFLHDTRRQLLQVSRTLHERLPAARARSDDAAGIRRVVREHARGLSADFEGELVEWAVECFTDLRDRDADVRLREELQIVVDGLQAVARASVHVEHTYRDQGVREAASDRASRMRFHRALGLLADSAQGVVLSAELARRLMVIDVLQVILATESMVLEQPVELMQLSAESRNDFTWHETAGDKLTGLQLHNFGAFYKRSWRANDWLWGRFDAIGWMTYLLLQPTRLRELLDLQRHLHPEPATFVDALLARLRSTATGATSDLDADARAWLASLWQHDVAEMREEVLACLDEPEADAFPAPPQPTSLPVTSRAVARGLQYALLVEELPRLRDDVAIDVANGASKRATLGWCKRFDREWQPESGTRDPKTPVRLLRDCPLPRERLADEIGTDLFTHVAATTAATGLKAGTAGAKVPAVFSAVLAAGRGVGVSLFYLSRWTLTQSKASFAALLTAVALGVVLLINDNWPSAFGMESWASAAGLALTGAGVVFGVLKAWGRWRTKASRWMRSVGAVWALVVTGSVLLLLAGPLLPPPATNAPARALRLGAQWLIDHPLAYWIFVSGALLAFIGTVPLQRRAERRSSVSDVREDIEDQARSSDIDLNLRLDSSITRHLVEDTVFVRRAAKAVVSRLEEHGAESVQLRVTGRPDGVLIDAAHDAKSPAAQVPFTPHVVGRTRTVPLATTNGAGPPWHERGHFLLPEHSERRGQQKERVSG